MSNKIIQKLRIEAKRLDILNKKNEKKYSTPLKHTPYKNNTDRHIIDELMSVLTKNEIDYIYSLSQNEFNKITEEIKNY